MEDFMTEYEIRMETNFEAKIHINCGYCGLLKGCKIRKTFIETAKQFTYKGFHKEFKLNCPFEIQKYKDGTEINFTVAYGAHKVKKEWECNRDCDECSQENCKDGIITFRNKRYIGKVNLSGKIQGYMGHGKYIVNVHNGEFIKVKHLFNRYDLLVLHKISNVFGWCGDDFVPNFVTKQRFILK